MTNEGSLLAFAADNNGRSPKTYAAIAANIWSSYKQHCTSDTFLRGDPTDGLRFLILDCEVTKKKKKKEEKTLLFLFFEKYQEIIISIYTEIYIKSRSFFLILFFCFSWWITEKKI